MRLADGFELAGRLTVMLASALPEVQAASLGARQRKATAYRCVRVPYEPIITYA